MKTAFTPTLQLNTDLWTRIVAFDLDQPLSEYGFSTRLAHENCWTQAFTATAILEYKKFMYLAATTDFMVSPSEIVDTVWHQHLIFTQSYTEFCGLLGRTIQHIPSTHNRDDYERFRQAKERTAELYARTFGEQPKAIWDYAGMFEGLALPKASRNIRTFVIAGILAFLVLTLPAYFLLRPLYVRIGNPTFILSYLALIALTFTGLEIYNRRYLNRLVKGFNSFAFVYHLRPLELVYLKTQSVANVVHGIMHQLLTTNQLVINPDNTLEEKSIDPPRTVEEFTVLETMRQLGATPYPVLLNQLVQKPVFSNVANSLDAFKKYLIKSERFGRLFYLNFGVLSLLLMLSVIRMATGLLRDKPVTQIFLLLLVVVVMMTVFLSRLTKLLCTHTIPARYTSELLPKQQNADAWEWRYFSDGTAVLTPSLIPLVSNPNKSGDTSDSSSSSGDSGCGSGGSCGGCGGD
ncbi:hypothetical protein GCM10023187_05160 [Nibrella viscosa]|uniref:TIGR04222 domain-containing protein n=1 Tax=Nibrella viscosa TaxID=1084524 RepID=A0ABP8JVC0_9BACT